MKMDLMEFLIKKEEVKAVKNKLRLSMSRISQVLYNLLRDRKRFSDRKSFIRNNNYIYYNSSYEDGRILNLI